MTSSLRTPVAASAGGTSGSYPRDRCVHELFEAQAARRPDAVALEFLDATLTYGELNQRADALAAQLRTMGVGPDVLVGLSVERSFELIVGMLGILKAGGAYVPLDASLPAERLQYLLDDTQAPVVLRKVQGALIAERTRHPPSATAGRPTSLNLVYVIYTSGSTGRPKGVMVPHLGVVRLVCQPDFITLSAQDVFLLLASISFDVSTFEIWGCLLNGGRLVIYPPGPLDFRELGAFIEARRITTLWLTAALFHEMMVAAPASMANLTYLLAGGDVLAPEHVRTYLSMPRHGRLINGYGPTENTTFTSCGVFDDAAQIAPGASVSIGRPISGTEVTIRDLGGSLVPDGEVGELWAGGDGLARGYLNAPELTAERFVADPLQPGTGVRWYRTGDIARWCPDGQLEFLGRRDRQVKIRGFRVELDEIESVLAGHPDLASCAVVVETPTARGPAAIDTRLVACVVFRRNDAVTVEALRRWLGERLPDYMIPARFVRMDELPVNASGKLDRQAVADRLARAEPLDRPVVTAGRAPQTTIERSIAAVWESLLPGGVSSVDAHFLEAGGHSLLAAIMAARISRELNVPVTIGRVLEHPTIASLAAWIEHTPKVVQRIPRANRERPLPMSSGQQRLWLLHQTLPDPSAYNEVATYRLTGAVDARLAERALAQMLARHEILRTRLVQTGGHLCQEIAAVPDMDLPWRVLDLEDENLVEQALEGEARRPFDLAHAPLWRALWIRVAGASHTFAVVFHHSIVDEWSWRVFFREWAQVYTNLSDAASPPLPPAESLQYADYAAWQQHRIPADRLAQLRSHWAARLEHAPRPVVFPGQLAGAPRTGRGHTHTRRLDATVIGRLRECARAEGITAFTVAFAAFQMWLHRWIGQADLVVATPFADREHEEVQGTLGFFLNTLPIRVRVDAAADFRTVLAQVNDAVMDAFLHAELPFEQIVEVAMRHRDAAPQPLHQILFVFVEEGLPVLKLGKAGARPVRAVGTRTSKTDLTVSLLAQGEDWILQCEYPEHLFAPGTIETLAGEFVALLESLTLRPSEEVDGRIATTRSLPLRLESAESLQSASAYEKPQDELERQMVRIWQSLLQAERIGVHDDFFDLGGHSLLAAKLFLRIEQELGTRLPLASLFEARSPRALAAQVRQGGPSAKWKSLVEIQASGTKPPLFVIHGLGGNVIGFRPLARRLGPDQPVYGLQSVGLDGVTAPLSSVPEMAAHYLSEIRAFQPHGPYHLAGLSMGGLIAYEVAQQMHRAGEAPARLIMLDAIPGYPLRHLPVMARATYAARMASIRWRGYWQELREHPLADIPAWVRQKWRNLSRRTRHYPDRSPLSRHNAAAHFRYIPQPYPGAVVLINADTHPRAHLDMYRSVWTRLALGGLLRFEVPGDHVTLLHEPHVQVLAQCVAKCLADA